MNWKIIQKIINNTNIDKIKLYKYRIFAYKF